MHGHGQVAAGAAVPDGDTVSPPELTADAPVSDVLQPVEVDAGEPLRDDAYVALGHCAVGLSRDAGGLLVAAHVDKPLHTDERLDHGGATLAVADGVAVRFHLLQHAQRFQFLHHAATGLEPLHLGVLASHLRHVAAFADDVGGVQAVPLPHLEVHRVVGRGDLQRAGAELRVDGLIAHHRDDTTHDGEDDVAAPDAVVARVVRMHRNPGVAQHRLGTGGSHGHGPAWVVFQRVANVIELTVHVLVVNFQIGEGGGAADAAVDDALVAIDQPLFIQADEGGSDGVAGAWLQREFVSFPVGGDAQPPRLLVDYATGLLDVLPDALYEGFAAHLVAAGAFFQ